MNLEKQVVASLLFKPSDIKNIELDLNWFSEKSHKEIVESIIDTGGNENDILMLAEKIKEKNPYSFVTDEYIYNLSTYAATSAHLPKYAKELEYRHIKDKLVGASERFTSNPTEENKDNMQNWMMKLDQLSVEEDTGSLQSTVDEIYYSLEHESEPGILTYKSIDKVLGGGMFGGTLITIGARPGVGKGNPNWVDIPTPDGNKKMGDLVVGDYVFDRYGKPTKVTGVYPRGELETYRVTLNDGRSTVVDGDHIWSYFSIGGDKKERLTNKTTKEMYELGTHLKKKKRSGKYGKHAKYSIPTNRAVEFQEKEHIIDPYVIGALIGDGALMERQLTISSNDEPVVSKVADLLGTKAVFSKSANYSWHFKLEEPVKNKKYLQTKDILFDYPELTTYSHLKEIPKEYLYTSIPKRMRLLNGLFDTDGHATRHKDKLNVGYTTTSKKLAEQIRWLLQSCGYLTGEVKDSRENRRDCYNITVLGQAEQLKELFTLVRKRKNAEEYEILKRRKYDRIAIKSIEKTGLVEEVTCISVENEEQLYLCNDFIVTHNTAFGINIAVEAMLQQQDIHIDFFTLEMSKKQMLNRFISRLSEINSYNLRDPYKRLDAKQKDSVISTTSLLLNSHFRIHDKLFELNQIARRIRKSHYEANGKPYIAFIDYLGLIDVKDQRQPRHVQVGEITRTMKILTNELDIPIILFTQLNRGIEARQDKEPVLSDIRESGAVEQDSNVVMFLSEPKDQNHNTDVIVAKNREGSLRKLRFNFLKSKMYFEEVD